MRLCANYVQKARSLQLSTESSLSNIVLSLLLKNSWYTAVLGTHHLISEGGGLGKETGVITLFYLFPITLLDLNETSFNTNGQHIFLRVFALRTLVVNQSGVITTIAAELRSGLFLMSAIIATSLLWILLRCSCA